MCQKKSFTLKENVPYLKLLPYNQTYMHEIWNICRHNKARKMWPYCGSTYYSCIKMTLYCAGTSLSR